MSTQNAVTYKLHTHQKNIEGQNGLDPILQSIAYPCDEIASLQSLFTISSISNS